MMVMHDLQQASARQGRGDSDSVPAARAPGPAAPLADVLVTLRLVALALVALALVPAPAQAAGSRSNQLEELTWMELRDRVATGSTTILVPIGGTEQNGPHMVLGKHNVRVRILAGEIAQRLGNALVAPVLAYVPEGAIHPPAAHMRFPGTISISDASFESLLDSTARSFCQHGFHHVVFLGDHGGYQKSLERVAARLNRELAADPSCRAHALSEYFRPTQTAYLALLKERGYSDAEIGTHAGLADTSLALAVDKSLVRSEALQGAAQGGRRDGVYGDPHRATAELGQLGVDLVIQSSVSAIQALQRERP